MCVYLLIILFEFEDGVILLFQLCLQLVDDFEVALVDHLLEVTLDYSFVNEFDGVESAFRFHLQF